MNWKYFILFMLIAIGLSVAVGVWHPASAYYFVEQGSTVYLGQTVDISGVAQGIQNLAYYDGYDCYGDNQYLLTMPKLKSGYYNFTVDPKIFSGRLGMWCKWNGYVESNGNLKAFIVSIAKPIQFNATENQSLQNPNQTPVQVPRIPLLPIQHISDYLVARGDPLSIPATGISDVWIFGARDTLLDYRSENGTVNFTAEIIDTLSPGMYKILIHTQDISKAQKTVRYNNQSGNLQWFDPETFTIQGFTVTDQTPETVFAKLKEIYSSSDDKYQLFSLEVQMPTVTINQIDSLNQLNDTGAPQAQGTTLQQQNYVDVRGYTNVAAGTIVKAIVDGNFALSDQQIWKDAYVTQTVGESAGDMREFKVLVALNLMNMVPGRHFISVKTALSDAVISTADFYVYNNPAGNAIPNKTIRYISGRYGPEEIVPTQTVTITIPVPGPTRYITVPVTPSNEQVLAQQLIAQMTAQTEINDKNWNRGALITGIIIVAIILILTGIYLFRTYRKAKKC